jgi:hypothetical protein
MIMQVRVNEEIPPVNVSFRFSIRRCIFKTRIRGRSSGYSFFRLVMRFAAFSPSELPAEMSTEILVLLSTNLIMGTLALISSAQSTHSNPLRWSFSMLSLVTYSL